MPSAGLVIGGTVRCEGSTQLFSSGPPPLAPVDWFGSGLARLSQATIAFTRGAHWPMYDTPAAPYECPAMPSCEGFNSFQNGLYGASRPAFTRWFCLATWLVPLLHDGTGSTLPCRPAR